MAGKRELFSAWAEELIDNAEISAEIVRLELLHVPTPTERLRSIPDDPQVLLEVALHASEDRSASYIISGFEQYLEELGADGSFEKRIYAGGLCFLPVYVPRTRVEEMARFSFLRIAREVPTIRPIDPEPFMRGSVPGFPVRLPESDPVDPELRVAVFDGGLGGTRLDRWASAIDSASLGSAPPGFIEHGTAVTSALLFGSLEPGEAARPYAYVDHYRVIDEKAADDPIELYDVLTRIQQVLSTRRYQFFSLSIGPNLPIEDDEVHSWTSVLDDYLSDGHTLATFAVGNNGEQDRESNNARVQVPSDCVNGLAVGAIDRRSDDWNRASYSALGPGRSPGVIKPDIVSFGGSAMQPFHVMDNSGVSRPVCGTSFASPATMRMALGIRAHLGGRLDPLAIKALLIHSADPCGHDRTEVGWGLLPDSLDDLIVCDSGEVRVLYQGELTPAKYLRARLPLPSTELSGMVTITATFCFASPVDPQDPGNYTRSGLDIWFRPHAEKFASDDAIHPKTKPFFRASDFDKEKDLRTDAHKWETVLSKSMQMRASSLKEPVFDVHYNARMSGGPNTSAEKVRYALVITVKAPRNEDIYDRVVQTYAGQLQTLAPVIEIPVTS
ncbi:S8 family serine peptidase [Amycolatopsis sp. RM579]|uniref:S8 family serine peptidase n=1 Tax=Amycolatopsis pithecellobii TaxID=664692 RepID=A0A6N7ZAR5_9PSEU|nr:S8 family serine peptidase [Amycolatopsis pithecellobii]